jgi:CRP-like cAMP-binding protein
MQSYDQIDLAQPQFDGAHASANGNGGPRAVRNRLLALLEADSSAEYERLLPLLETVELAHRQVLYDRGAPITHVYFPEGSVASLVKVLSNGRKIEVGTTGCEGVVGLPAFLDADSSPHLCVAQVPGMAKRLSAAALREAAPAGSELHRRLQRYVQYLFGQAAQSVACNGLHRVNKRCARWLLMTHDRAQRDQFALTHEYLATMLAVRRASVSAAAEALQHAGLIRYRRGKMTVVDRPGLEQVSCECYLSDRAELERLLPLEERSLETTDAPQAVSAPAGAR